MRICNEAKDMDFFDSIQGFTEVDLMMDQEFWNNNGSFVANSGRGFGYWIWKPHIINKELEKLNDGDILIYTDSGCEINKNGRERLLEYIHMLDNDPNDYGLISFTLPFKEYQYTKALIFEFFEKYKDISNIEELKNQNQCVGGIQIIKKNKHSSFRNRWRNALWTKSYRLYHLCQS